MITQFVYDRPGLVTTMCAVVAGPVTVAGDPVSPDLWQAAMMGAVGGVIVSVTPPFLARFRIDDAGFVVPTHLILRRLGRNDRCLGQSGRELMQGRRSGRFRSPSSRLASA